MTDEQRKILRRHIDDARDGLKAPMADRDVEVLRKALNDLAIVVAALLNEA